MRIGGLASGMDIDQIVTDLMRVERERRVTSLERDKQTAVWRQESYHEINRDMANFVVDMRKEFGLNNASNSSSSYFISNTDELDWVKTASISDSTIANVTATNAAPSGSYSFEILQLAANVKKSSTTDVTGFVGTNSDIEIQSSQGTATINVLATDTIQDVVDKINAENATLGLTASYDSSTGKASIALGTATDFRFNSETGSVVNAVLNFGVTVGDDVANNVTSAASSKRILDRAGTASDVEFVTKGGTTSLSFAASDTLGDVADKINDADIGLTAFYDEQYGRFFLNTTESGEENFFRVNSDTGNLFNGTLNLGLTIGDNDANNETGQNLRFRFDGVPADPDYFENASNSFSFNGFSIEAKTTGTFSTTVTSDVDSAVEKIEAFVEKYNTMLEKINSKLSEKKHYGFEPLSKEQKESLSESEIELWEERAKSGLLKNDSITSGMISKIRSGFYEPVYRSYTDDTTNELLSTNLLRDIGISSTSYSDRGKLTIDQDKLRTALQENPQNVMDILFRAPSDDALNDDDDDLTDAQVEQKYKESGVFNRMFNSMINGMKEVIDRAGAGDDAETLRSIKFNIMIDFVTDMSAISTIDSQVLDFDKRISDQEDLLVRIENRYWSQYSAMESAINQMNQQSAWLSQQLG